LLKISFNRHKILEWLERELLAILAVAIVGLGTLWVAASDNAVTTMSLTVMPAGGETITVLIPNGGESWQIGSTQNITWNATFTITDVKIELQQTVAGAWETIIASTTNDGSYPWVVTGPATTTATVRISKVGDASVNDTSNVVFSITVPAAAPGGGGGGGLSFTLYPAIDDVAPYSFSNQTDVVLQVRGINFTPASYFTLGHTTIPIIKYVDAHNVQLKVPAGLLAGKYSMSVYNTPNVWMVWGRLIEITVPVKYAAQFVRQSESRITLQVGQTTSLWVEYKNVGTLPWTNFGKNPVRLGTGDPRDRNSVFRYLWSPFNRPAKVVALNSKSSRQVINPGEVGRFTFKIKAPKTNSAYKEAFEPLAEFAQWMSEPVRWEITVVSKPAKTPAVKQPVTGKSTGSQIAPMPNLPQGPAAFYDITESWLRAFTNFFSRLVGGLISGIKR